MGRSSAGLYIEDMVIMLVLIMIGLLLYFYRLGDLSFMNPDEGRFAQAAKEMLRRNEWILPYFRGEILSTKPILYFWMIILSFKWLGISELSARLPSALMATAGLFLVYWTGKIAFNRAVGCLSAIILATSCLYFFEARFAHADISLTFFITLSLCCFYLGYISMEAKSKKRFYLLFYVGMALATLTKGPVGVVIPSVVVLTFLILSGNVRAIGEMNLFWGSLIFMAIVLPWFVSATLKGGYSYLRILLIQETGLTPFFNAYDHREPLYFYFISLFNKFAPWSLFLPAAFSYAMMEKNRKDAFPLLFFLSWFLVIFIFFSLADAKRDRYILPLYPAAAIIVGWAWERVAFQRKRASWWFLIPSYLLITSPFFIIPLYQLYAHHTGILIEPVRLVIIFFVVLLITFTLFQRSQMKYKLFAMNTAVLLTIGILMLREIYPQLDYHRSPKILCDAVNSIRRAEDRPLIVYGLRNPCIDYYLEQPIYHVSTLEDIAKALKKQHPVYILIPNKELGRLEGDDFSVIGSFHHVIHRKLSISLITNVLPSWKGLDRIVEIGQQ